MCLCQKGYNCTWLRLASGDTKGVCIAGPRCVVTEQSREFVYDERLREVFKRKVLTTRKTEDQA